MAERGLQQNTGLPINSVVDRAEIYKVELNLTEKNDVRVIAYDYVTENSTTMDVGCACGDFGELLKHKKCNVYGMEYDAGSVDIASNTGVYKKIHQVDLNKFRIENYPQYLHFFDSIAFLDVLEHTLEPEKVLFYFSSFLKDGGHFIISLPNISFCDIKVDILNNDFTYTDTGILDRTHIKFYTYKSISEMMTRLNVEISECKPKVAYFSRSCINLPSSIIRYIKKDPHSFVYQYVLKAKASTKNKTELKIVNNRMTNLEWNSVSVELNKLKRRRWVQTVIPLGSRRNKWARKIKKIYMGRKIK